MDISKHLLPRYCRIIGLIILLLSAIFTIDRFYYGHKYHFLKFKVFSFYSEFLTTREFSFTRNNQSEEIIVIITIIGLAFIAFSKEKFENESVNSLRIKALIVSFLTNICITIIGTLLFHGLGNFYFISILQVIPMATYYTIFKFYYIRDSKAQSKQV